MNLCDINACTGCSACATVCPQKAISLQYNERGFLNPIIDKEKCINCNMCSKVCEKLKQHMEGKNHCHNFYLAYALKIKDENKRMQSQSGGLFTALAETVIEKGGSVYGAGFDEKNHVKHFRVTRIEELDNLKGSKYVQSDINNSFELILYDLLEGKVVLFSGTPCQVAGIESLLDFKKINRDNFYSCDLICHGVPSPQIYENYICLLEKKMQKKIKKFNFRDKSITGWKNPIATYSFEQDERNKTISKVYGDMFYSNLALRKSCENCKYASKNRPGDITMGDCWGIEKINPNLWNDNKGISVALIQTKHGEELFEMAKEKMDVYKINAEEYNQENMAHSSSIPYQKEKFWKDYKKMSFEKLLKKYTIYGGIMFKIKRRILKKINRW